MERRNFLGAIFSLPFLKTNLLGDKLTSLKPSSGAMESLLSVGRGWSSLPSIKIGAYEFNKSSDFSIIIYLDLRGIFDAHL
jgi:hypothetical protein